MSWPRLLWVSLSALLLLPVGAATGCAVLGRPGSWWEARRDASGQAPDPAIAREAVIQVYAARTVGIRGALGVHSWIAVKPTGAPVYTRYEVVGWGVGRGAPPSASTARARTTTGSGAAPRSSPICAVPTSTR